MTTQARRAIRVWQGAGAVIAIECTVTIFGVAAGWKSRRRALKTMDSRVRSRAPPPPGLSATAGAPRRWWQAIPSRRPANPSRSVGGLDRRPPGVEAGDLGDARAHRGAGRPRAPRRSGSRRRGRRIAKRLSRACRGGSPARADSSGDRINLRDARFTGSFMRQVVGETRRAARELPRKRHETRPRELR